MTLAELRQISGDPVTTTLPVQITSVTERRTANGKPFFDLEVADSTDKMRFKIWSDTDAFEYCSRTTSGAFAALGGEIFCNDYGLNINRPSLADLDEDAVEALLAGTPERAARLEEDWQYLQEVFNNLDDPRLRLLTQTVLQDLEAKWKRAAAARSYHHARRGGLLEHTAQMLRCAEALAPQYPEIWPDLLLAGVLFHDIGKCWENDYPARGFISTPIRMGELLGHINIGVEVVNRYWHQLSEAEPGIFENQEASPPSDRVREYLLHLIVSHHGQLDFGSPVTPKIPEAWMLHYIDNLDARMEMMRGSYAQAPEVEPDLFKAQRPLSGYLARPIRGAQGSTTD